MFKNFFGGGGSAADSSKGPAAAASPNKSRVDSPSRHDAHTLLSLAQDALQRLRVMQPTDTEAFPLLNEASRYGRE